MKVLPTSEELLLKKYRIGFTNMCKRPTKDQSDLTKEEIRRGVAFLKKKLVHYKPKIVCFVGVTAFKKFV